MYVFKYIISGQIIYLFVLKKYKKILKVIKNAHDNILVQNGFSLSKYTYLIRCLKMVCALKDCFFVNIQLLIFP